MLQEVSERELCAHNVLVYGLSESSSTSAPQRISDDKIALGNTLGQYSSIIPKSTMKLVRLGKVRQDDIRPLKIIFQSKDEPINFIRGFTDAKLGGAMFPTSFRIVRDKTLSMNVVYFGLVIPNLIAGLHLVRLVYGYDMSMLCQKLCKIIQKTGSLEADPIINLNPKSTFFFLLHA